MTTNTTITNQELVKQTFRQFIEQRLLVADFNKLPNTLGLSVRKTNRVLNHPKKVDMETIIKLDEILDGAVIKVLDQYKIGYDCLTVSQYKKLTK